jgi:hypothetical protein
MDLGEASSAAARGNQPSSSSVIFVYMMIASIVLEHDPLVEWRQRV